MKKFLVNLLIVICIIGFIGFLGGMERTYTREGQVVCVKGNIVTVEDKSGFLWELETDELKEGQEVVLKMNDNNTDGIITDDIIVDYKINQNGLLPVYILIDIFILQYENFIL